MDETGYRMKEYDILAFCLCLIRCSEPFQLSSRVKEMDAEMDRFSDQLMLSAVFSIKGPSGFRLFTSLRMQSEGS